MESYIGVFDGCVFFEDDVGSLFFFGGVVGRGVGGVVVDKSNVEGFGRLGWRRKDEIGGGREGEGG